MNEQRVVLQWVLNIVPCCGGYIFIHWCKEWV